MHFPAHQIAASRANGIQQGQIQSRCRINNANTKLPPRGWDRGSWPTRPDEELLGEYVASGSHEAFEDLVHRYEVELYNYLRNYLADPEAAEDAFQGTFLQVHLKCHQFDPNRRVRALALQDCHESGDRPASPEPTPQGRQPQYGDVRPQSGR